MNYYVYITTNKTGSVLYTGVTSDLVKRTWQHREKVVPSFTSKYNATRLVYYEGPADRAGAYEREAQIKAGSRKKKLALIAAFNPEWRNLYDDL